MQNNSQTSRIIDHTSPKYIAARSRLGANRYNGTYYYSKEIVRNIIPLVKTDRTWITVHSPSEYVNHSIVFVHNNILTKRLYGPLKRFEDVVLVCGVPETVEKVADYGKAIYLPLSIDIEEVSRYRQPKTRDCCFAGRWSKKGTFRFPPGCEFLHGMPREQMLKEMATFRKVYAVGRTALEARVLGCEIGVYDPRFPDPSIWQPLDNKEAAKILQHKLDEIDN